MDNDSFISVSKKDLKGIRYITCQAQRNLGIGAD